MKRMVIAVSAAILIAGCMSFEEQLNSSDPAVRMRAEKSLESIALDTNEWTGGAKKEERIAAIQRLKSQDSLLRVATTNLNDDRFNGLYWDNMFREDVSVYGPCIDKLDQAHLVAFILAEEQYQKEQYKGYVNQRKQQLRYRRGGDGELDESAETFSADLFLSAIGGRSLNEMMDSPEAAIEYQKKYGEKVSPRLWYAVSKLSDPEAIATCFSKTKNPQVKASLFPKVLSQWQYVSDKYELAVILKVACQRQTEKQKKASREKKKRLQRIDPQYIVTDATKKGIVEKIDDQKLYAEMMKKDSKFSIDDSGVMKAIAFKLPENKVFELAKKSISEHTIRSWNNHDVNAFIISYAAFKRTNDAGKKKLIVDLTVGKIQEYRHKCIESMSMTWGSEDKEQVKVVIDAWGDDLPAEAKAKLERM